MTSRKAKLRPLGREFYTRSTLVVAEELLGKCLVRQLGNARLVGRIVETEAYVGEDDPACHARFGRTDRNSIMYGQGGFSYIYFIYGMHNMFNIVTEREEFPAAVLVRALEPLEGIVTMQRLRETDVVRNLTNGPGRLCQAFALDTSHSGIDLTEGDIYVSFCERAKDDVAVSSRIGIKQGTERKWRFYIEGNPFVSR